VTIFEPNVAEFSEEQMRILIFHELLHVGEDGKSVRPHDLEDFKVIINRFGTEWNVV
jgi:predicted SprT family Zn-dependent metalloprotease